jgi:hypothetical protein
MVSQSFLPSDRYQYIALYNNSTAFLFVKFGPNASPSSYSVRMGPHDFLELKEPPLSPVDGVWSAQDGHVMVTVF